MDNANLLVTPCATGAGSAFIHLAKLMIEERIDFQNADETVLSGSLYKPENHYKYPAVIVAHYSHGGVRKCAAYQYLAELLTQMGIAVLVFDRRGQGQSGGDFSSASFEDLTHDLLSAKNALKLRRDVKLVGLWGMSQGGWLAPFAASLSGDISFLIIVSGATTTPAEQMNYSATFALKSHGCTAEDIDRMRATRKLHDDYYRKMTSRSSLREELEKVKSQAWFPFAYVDSDVPADVEGTTWHQILDFDPTPSLKAIRVPTLVLYADVDPWIDVDESLSRWRSLDLSNLTVQRIKGANHFMLTISGSGIDRDVGTVSNRYQEALSGWLDGHILKTP